MAEEKSSEIKIIKKIKNICVCVILEKNRCLHLQIFL